MHLWKFASHQGIFKMYIKWIAGLWYNVQLVCYKREKNETQQWIITCQIKHYFCVLQNIRQFNFGKYQDCQISRGGWRKGVELGGRQIERQSAKRFERNCENSFLHQKFDNKLYTDPSFRLKFFQFRLDEKLL